MAPHRLLLLALLAAPAAWSATLETRVPEAVDCLQPERLDASPLDDPLYRNVCPKPVRLLGCALPGARNANWPCNRVAEIGPDTEVQERTVAPHASVQLYRGWTYAVCPVEAHLSGRFDGAGLSYRCVRTSSR
ncbi:hypothetical protein [Jeongeupia sp. USM3]|uniref:hypothetical protein n=1 Tax=Jeongeupia sp. USM3 TaxID=1906741 RepID=UPI00089DEA81|nr:hypothetical protein [Jeongeupia sp. USM3]AOY01651.1 hypothetical protein BJP62_15025 [Jeongeupia sp. USM3]